LCSEQPYNNKQAAQLQSSQATQNEYIFKDFRGSKDILGAGFF